MFKESLSALSSTLVGAVKSSANQYKPTAQNMGGAFTRVAEQGIANLSYRSPILADLAATMLHSFQSELIRRDQIRQFNASDKANTFRDEIKAEMGPKSSTEAVNKRMFEVIDKLDKIVAEQGGNAKNDDFFKKYADLYQKYRGAEQKEKAPATSAPQSSDSTDILAQIQVNTANTAQLIGELAATGGTGTGNSTGENTQKSVGASFIDPMTGLPSMRAAVGSIGGSFLAKVFDDETITKYADKTREKLFGATKTVQPVVDTKVDEISDLTAPDATPKVFKPEPIKAPSVSDILGDLSLDLTKPISSEAESENDAQDNKKHKDTKDLHTKTNEHLSALVEQGAKAAEEKGGMFSGLIASVGSLVPILGSVMPVIATVGSALMAALPAIGAVVGGAALGLAVGTAAKETIDWGISKVTGREETLGGWLHDAINGDPNAEWEAQNAKKIAAKKTTPASNAAAAQAATDAAKARAEAKTNAKSGDANVAINNNTNTQNTNIVVGASVRNQESSFDRVQTSNHWGRTP